MKNKIAYAVFTLTDSGKDYIVKGNFGSAKGKAEKWAKDHSEEVVAPGGCEALQYPNGLFVKRIEY